MKAKKGHTRTIVKGGCGRHGFATAQPTGTESALGSECFAAATPMKQDVHVEYETGAARRDGVLLAGGAILAAASVWAYWPTLGGLIHEWNNEPDYSHGFFVAPLALFFLSARRDQFPGIGSGALDIVGGLALIAASLAIRATGAHFYLEALDGWSILPWVGGVVLLLVGRRAFWWSLPSIVFLWFMVPLPFRVERWLSLPLQGAATRLSCWILQALGQPALAEAHVIVLGNNRLEVEQACSGLRIFMGIVALAFVYAILVRRHWSVKAILLISALLIALLANSARIVATGLLYQYASSEAAKKFSHNASGWVMIVFAAGLFGLVLWYLLRLVREVETVGVGDVIRRDRG